MEVNKYVNRGDYCFYYKSRVLITSNGMSRSVQYSELLCWRLPSMDDSKYHVENELKFKAYKTV